MISIGSQKSWYDLQKGEFVVSIYGDNKSLFGNRGELLERVMVAEAELRSGKTTQGSFEVTYDLALKEKVRVITFTVREVTQ